MKTDILLRAREIVPRLAGMGGDAGEYRRFGNRGLAVQWSLGDGSMLTLLANLGDLPAEGPSLPRGRLLYAFPEDWNPVGVPLILPAWSVAWFLDER